MIAAAGGRALVTRLSPSWHGVAPCRGPAVSRLVDGSECCFFFVYCRSHWQWSCVACYIPLATASGRCQTLCLALTTPLLLTLELVTRLCCKISICGLRHVDPSHLKQRVHAFDHPRPLL